IGNEQALVKLLHEKLPKSCRMHVVGVGAAVNRTLATSIARAGHGAEILVGLDNDVERTAKRLFDRTGAPVLTDVTIADDAVISCSPMHVPDVFANAPLLAAVCLNPEGGTIVVLGSLAHGTWEKKITVRAIAEGEGSEAITKLYAREHVADCEMRWTMGKDTEAIDDSIESTGLEFQIATRLTSWIAIDEERRVDGSVGSRHEVQPHELPYG